MKKRLLFLMLSACVFCAVSLKFLSEEEKRQNLFEEARETLIQDVQEDNIETRKNSMPAGEENHLLVAESSEDLAEENENVTGDIEKKLPEKTWIPGEFAYAYYCLDEKEQRIYREIYDILINFGEDMPVSTTNPELIGDIFQCVLNDCPEIFYVQGYTYTTYAKGDEIVRLTLSGTYTMTPEEVSWYQEGIDDYVQECLTGLLPEASDYEKVKYVYEYLIENTEYQQNAPENQNICSVFLNGKSVCQGYAKATQYLLNKAGVFCTLVIGSVSEGEGHAWNLVQMDGNYYYVDTTWGDASYQMEETVKDAWEQKFPEINYDYLGVTTEQLLKTHTLNNVVPLPFCISMDCNYYVKEGTYLTSSDEETLRQLFAAEYNSEQGSFTIKCSDESVYRDVKRILIEEQKIFSFLHQTDGSVAYSDNDEQLSLSFWQG